MRIPRYGKLLKNFFNFLISVIKPFSVGLPLVIVLSASSISAMANEEVISPNLDDTLVSTEHQVSRAMVQLVRNEFRMAIHITERLIACFKNDSQWLLENYQDFKDKESLCEGRVNSIREKVKKRLSLMRIYLALSLRSKPVLMTSVFSKTEPYQYPLDPRNNQLLELQAREMPELVNSLYPWIVHSYSNVELEPLNRSEVAHGIEILNNDLQWVLSKYGSNPPSIDATCFIPDKSFPVSRTIPEHRQGQLAPIKAVEFTGDGIGVGERDCYYRLYLAMIFGSDFSGISWYREIEGFPLLAYISSDTPNDKAIIDGLEKRLSLTVKAKSKFEEKYYTVAENGIDLQIISNLELSDVAETFVYEDLSERLAERDEEYRLLVDKGRKLFKKQTLVRTAITVGAVIGATIACEKFIVGKLIKGLCKMPFGLGFNAYMATKDEGRLRDAVDDMLMSPDGMRVLNHMDSISDYEFSRNLSLLFLPVGTGLVDVAQGLKPTFSSIFKQLR